MSPLCSPETYVAGLMIVGSVLSLLMGLAAWLDDRPKKRRRWPILCACMGFTAWECQIGRFQVNILRFGYWPSAFRGRHNWYHLPIKFIWWGDENASTED